MKNRKILYLTVFSVVAVIIGIICFSRLAESIWQATGEIDNNLKMKDFQVKPITIIPNGIKILMELYKI